MYGTATAVTSLPPAAIHISGGHILAFDTLEIVPEMEYDGDELFVLVPAFA